MIDLFKNYFEKRIALIKLDAIDTTANIAAALTSLMIVLVITLFILLMLSLSLGYFIGQLFNDIGLGFLIVAGIYLLLFIIIFVFGKDKIENKVRDAIVSSSMKSSNKNLDN